MALVGYVRVSTAAQDGALQRGALVKAGKRFTACNEPFDLEPSAPSTAGRPSRCRPSPEPLLC